MSDDLVKTRTPHYCCAGCDVRIEAGELAHSGPWFGGGRVGRWWMHPICRQVGQAIGWFGEAGVDRWPLPEVDSEELPEPLRSDWRAHLARRGGAR